MRQTHPGAQVSTPIQGAPGQASGSPQFPCGSPLWHWAFLVSYFRASGVPGKEGLLSSTQ
jgi:hypothetical protein